ncbi:hypothetical protein [Kineosporia succinea]|uniref:Uncharacterized protein n=1 Tax=Kineosporia succinea TaxID=84632 RepID=A0ABT9P9I8_9ACTN|nr:hypothetical protein [Kineosporia succinea]MDP9829359.1 hypothetical protein [Kineosporia succinea]
MSDKPEWPECQPFNWHQLQPDSFLYWMLPVVLPRGEAFEELAKASDDFKSVDLRITANGIEMDALAFLRGVHANMRLFAHREAERIVMEETSLTKVEETMASIREQVERHLREELTAAGVQLRDEEGW